MDEKTSSSASLRHIGHHKASLEDMTLVLMHATMMSMAYKYGFSFDRWKTVVDVMLPKEEGLVYWHCMRIIRLCETDFNQSLAITFARPMGHFLEDNAVYPEMQYGSRDGQMCISAVLNKVLTFDIVRLQRCLMAVEEKDAVGCYDRVIQVLPSLYLQHMGVSEEAITAVCRTFDETRHLVKTSYGTSTKTYEGTSSTPLYGAGQGTTVGPFFWLIMFCLIYDSFDLTLKGIQFTSACRQIQAERYGNAFVDDTQFGVTALPSVTDEELTSEAQEAQEAQIIEGLQKLGQQYEWLLLATGGALNLKKCHWILIAWRWVHGKAYIAPIKEAPGSLLLTSGYSTEVEEVPRFEPGASYRTLGVHLTVTGSMKKAQALLRNYSTVFAGHLGSANLTRCEAYFAYTLYFYPKILYSVPVSTFTKKDCTYLQAPAISAFLSNIGLNQHTARSIVHGPEAYGGLQLPDTYADQGIGQLRLFLGHLRRRDPTSKLIMIAISYLQLRVGSKPFFLNLPYTKYAGWVEKTWLTSLWQFLHIAKLQLDGPFVGISEKRQGDAFLTTEFIYHGFCKSDLELINQCRLYHQVITVSDIASADGKSIDHQYTTNERHKDRQSTLQWPSQGCPSKAAWSVWNKALAHLLDKNKLQQPVGGWIHKPHQEWHWKVRLTDNSLYHLVDREWWRFRPIAVIQAVTREDTKPWYDLSAGQLSAAPEGPSIAAATFLLTFEGGDVFCIVASAAFPEFEPECHPYTVNMSISDDIPLPADIPFSSQVATFLLMTNASPYFARLIGPILPPQEADLVDIGNNIVDGTLLLCSDGSFDPWQSIGCHAWVFADILGNILLQGAGPIDGQPDQVSVYRAELGGITANLYLLAVIIKLMELKEGSVTLYCDNKSALEAVFDPMPKRGIYPMLAVDYDLILVARDLYRSLPVKITAKHVKGHYTGDYREVQHDFNALADTMAEDFRKNPPEGFVPVCSPLTHPMHGAVVEAGGAVITSKLSQVIYGNLYLDPLLDTIWKRYKWDDNVYMEDIDWTAHGRAFKSYSRFQQIGITKLVHGLWHTGAQKVLYRKDDEGLCPCCSRAIETSSHVFQCRDPSVTERRQKELS